MKTTKTNPAKLLLRYLWPRMQRGERHFIIDDTQLAFSMTAQQLSKVVRRFNETGHELARFSFFREGARHLPPRDHSRPRSRPRA